MNRPSRFMTVDADGEIVALVAEGEDFGPTGGTDFPIADRDAAWSGSDAAQACAKWAGVDGDDPTAAQWSKYGSCFFWTDPSAKDKKSGYKLGFVDIVNGKPTVIPKGVFASAAAINGARGGVDIPTADESGVKSKISGWYTKMASKFNDKSLKPPWALAEDERAEALARLHEITDLADTKTCPTCDGDGTIRGGNVKCPDCGGSGKVAAAVEGGDPMGHTASTETHDHEHSAYGAQGGDETHSHEHSHNGDSSHDHHAAHAMAERLDLLTEHEGYSEVVLAAFDNRKVWLPLTWGNELESGEREVLVAAAGDIEQVQLVDNPGGAWHAYLCVEGVMTDESTPRELMPGSCQFPDLPVSLRFLIHDEGGHFGAVTVGSIDTMERQELAGMGVIYAEGTFTPDHHGQLAQMHVEQQSQRFISIDPRDYDAEIISVQVDSQPIGGIYDMDDPCVEPVAQQWLRFTSLVIGAATIVPMPALQQAVITPADVPLPMAPLATERAQPSVQVVTASGELSSLPPKAWFEDPGFHVGDSRLVRQPDGKMACPPTLTPEGRYFGHACYWGQEHTAGLRDRRGNPVTPPRGATYAHYLTGERETADGSVAVGQITMGCGHAGLGLGAAPAKAHYDGGYGAVQMVDVVVGEDDFGIWMAGAVKPFKSDDLPDGPSPEQVRQFRTQEISPDWRKIAGQLHMIALLAVPVGGFPIARESLVAAGHAEIVDLNAVRAGLGKDSEIISLVAAGRVHRSTESDRLSRLEHIVDGLVASAEADAEAREREAVFGRLQNMVGV